MFFAYGEAELTCLRARDKRLCEVCLLYTSDAADE